MEPFITSAQLREAGLTYDQITAQVRDQDLRRLRRGIYLPSRAEEARSPEHLVLAAAAMAYPDAAVSHQSAARLHGLPVPEPPLPVLSRHRRGSPKETGGVRLRVAQLPEHHLSQIDRIPVTTLARTVVDTLRTSPREWGLATADVFDQRQVPAAELGEVMLYSSGWPGITRARDLLAFRDGRSESPAESISRLRFREWGLPQPDLQYVFHIDGHVDRVDFYWPRFGVVGECDGYVKYAEGEEGRRALWREKKREDRIRSVVRAFIRWTWDDLWGAGRSLAARLHSVLK